MLIALCYLNRFCIQRLIGFITVVVHIHSQVRIKADNDGCYLVGIGNQKLMLMPSLATTLLKLMLIPVWRLTSSGMIGKLNKELGMDVLLFSFQAFVVDGC